MDSATARKAQRGFGLICDRLHASTYTEVVIRFAQWMQARSVLKTTARDVRDHFPVSQATSFRWLNAWRAANGLPPLAEDHPSHRNRKRK